MIQNCTVLLIIKFKIHHRRETFAGGQGFGGLKHRRQTRTFSLYPNSKIGRQFDAGAHCEQTRSPHFLQWCLLLVELNFTPQCMHSGRSSLAHTGRSISFFSSAGRAIEVAVVAELARLLAIMVATSISDSSFASGLLTRLDRRLR
jgi:hypothetical protein